MKKHFKGEDGLTFVELVIAVAIAAVITLSLVNVFSSSDKAYRYSFSQSQNAMAAQNALSSIVSELKYIDGLTVPASNTSSTTADYTISGTPGKIYRDASSKGIVIERNGSISKRLAEGLIQAVTFQRSDSSTKPEKITINISVNSNVPDSQALTASTTVVLLNL